MPLPASARLITYEDSLAMPESRLEEVVRGELRTMAPPIDRHAFLVHALTKALERQLDADHYVVLPDSFGLGIERRPYLTYRIPDLTVFSTAALRRDRAAKAENDPYIWAVPELVAECLSPSNRKGPIEDLLRDYAQLGIPEVWLLDPKRRALRRCRLEAGSYLESLHSGQELVSPLRLHGVQVNLGDLWRAFDEGPAG